VASTGAGSAQSAAEGTSRTTGTGGEWAWRYRSLAYCMYVCMVERSRSELARLGALLVAVSGNCKVLIVHRCFWLGLAVSV
jgi:hypothetical protein